VEGGLGPLDDSNAMIDDAQQLFVPHRLPARFACLIVGGCRGSATACVTADAVQSRNNHTRKVRRLAKPLTA
jgi:hypothetical protein